jgi:excisionase family DNA binding protein
MDNFFAESGMIGEDILKLKDVALLLKVSEKTVYSMAQNGELPAFKVRGQWRFSRVEIADWIEAQKRSSASVDAEKPSLSR